MPQKNVIYVPQEKFEKEIEDKVFEGWILKSRTLRYAVLEKKVDDWWPFSFFKTALIVLFSVLLLFTVVGTIVLILMAIIIAYKVHLNVVTNKEILYIKVEEEN